MTACPHNDSYDETTCALKFATRVRRINLGPAHKNDSKKNLEETVKSLTSKISLLSKAKESSESQLLLLKREKERMEEKLSKASISRDNSKEEMRSLTALRQTNNEITSRCAIMLLVVNRGTVYEVVYSRTLIASLCSGLCSNASVNPLFVCAAIGGKRKRSSERRRPLN